MSNSLCVMSLLTCTVLTSPRAAEASDLNPGETATRLESIQVLAEAGKTAKALVKLERFLARVPAEDRTLAWHVPEDRSRSFGQACRVGELICLQTSDQEAIRVLDTATGTWRKPLVVAGFCRVSPMRMSPTADGRELFLATPNKLALVDAQTGEVKASLDLQLDVRIAPMKYRDDFVLVNGPDGNGVLRVSRKGETVWSCHPGDKVVMHPAVYGPVLVVHTKDGMTTALDLETGETMWSDRVGGDGCGAAFGDDATFLVEAGRQYTPDGWQGRVIGRDPRSGERRWEYQRPGSIRHRPLVDLGRNLVFAAFDDGVIVGLKGRDGTLVWESRLPAGPPEPALGWQPSYWPVLGLYEDGGCLIVLDCNDELHFLDAENGRQVARFAVASSVSADGRMQSYNDVQTMPWVQDGKLIVVCRREIAAYPIRQVVRGGESPELVARALRLQLLLKQGRLPEAAEELARMQVARSHSPITLQAAADLCQACGDPEGEVIARLRLMRTQGLTSDKRLRKLTGLEKRAFCGPEPTPPLLVDNDLFVGARDGTLRAFTARKLAPAGEMKAPFGIVGRLTHYHNLLIVPLESRHLYGMSLPWRPLFNMSVPDAPSYCIELRGNLLWSARYAGFVRIAPIDFEQLALGPETRLDAWPPVPVSYQGRLICSNHDGASTSYDGSSIEVHPARLKVDDYRVNVWGDRPVAYGTGGVYEVDEHLRPVKLLARAPTRAFAAARNRGVIVALSEQKDSTALWRLEAWTESGEKLPLDYATPRYRPWLDHAPTIQPLDDGFLLAGRELVYVDPYRKDPVWRFWPGGTRGAHQPKFSRPILDGDYVYAAHVAGDLFMFRKSSIVRPSP